MLNLYLVPFLLSFASSVILIFVIRFFSNKIVLRSEKKREGKRHFHDTGVSRWGGIAIAISFLGVVLLDKNLVLTKDTVGILLGGLLMFGVGIWDDFKEISWKKQLFFQIGAVFLIFIFGVRIYYISNPFGNMIQLDSLWGILAGILLAGVWSIILMNSMNWLDGIDGISMGIYFIGILSIFLLSLKPEVNQPPVGIIAVALSGAVLGFLMFNFPPAKIMAGSNGIFFVGFIVASLSVFAGTKIATTLLILFIPLIDFFWVILKRIKFGKSIFSADREHLHHKLTNIGWSQKKINIFFYLVTILVASVALNVSGWGKILIIVGLILIMLFFYGFINRKEKLILR
ncbi:MAG: MraY family glycosyltransferase [Parcubacteria group bacterium]|jgi:UDP-GlcNAc:undecaprenyl-phosphate GlcNAc-1-phosphate transferase